MRLAFLFFIILSGGPCYSASNASLSPADKTLLRVLNTGQIKADLTLIPPDQKEAIILRLQKIAQQKEGSVEIGTASVHVTTADLLLLRMGDIFTMERMVQDYRAYDSMVSWDYVQTLFEQSHQPLLIPYLAQDFYSNEDPNKGIAIDPPPGSQEFGVSVPARSIFSGVTVVRIIEKAPEFSPEMKAWTQSAYEVRYASSTRFRNLMRAFWEKNKAAFERKDYQAVVPVGESDVAPNLPTIPSTTPPIIDPEAKDAKEAKSETAPAPLIPASGSWAWTFGVIAGILILALILISKRKA